MNAQVIVSTLLFAAGIAAMVMAMRQERLMQRHRQPGLSYRAVTLRRDGGWRRSELFTGAGLEHQRTASRYGVAGALLWLAALAVWIGLGMF